MSLKPAKLKNLYSDPEFYNELRKIGILAISREPQYNLMFPENSTVRVEASNDFLTWIEDYLIDKYYNGKEAELRSQHPGLEKVYLDYQFLLKLCRSPNG